MNKKYLGVLQLATPSAKEAVLVANTPGFLLNRLRRDTAVQTVIDTMSFDNIVMALRDSLSHAPSNALDLVPSYIYLTALSVANPTDINDLDKISSLDLSNLEWGNAMRSMILAEAIPTTTKDIHVCNGPR